MVWGWSWSRKMNDLSSATSAPDHGGQLFDDEAAQLLAKLAFLSILWTRTHHFGGVSGVAASTKSDWAGLHEVARDRIGRHRCLRRLPRHQRVVGRQHFRRVDAVGDAGEVDQVPGFEVLPERAAPDEAGADGHRRCQAGAEARAAGAPADVDRNPQDAYGGRKVHHGAWVVAVYHGRMPRAADAQQRDRSANAALHTRDADHAKHRA